MTTFLIRCNTLDAKLKALSLAKRYADDMKHIQQRTAEWKVLHVKLRTAKNQTSPLTLLAEDSKKVAAKQVSLRQNAEKVLARLTENDDIKELTRDAAWTRLLKASEGLTVELEAAGRTAWRLYLEEFGTLESPETLTQRAPPTPHNQEALKVYKGGHTAFAAIARMQLPKSPDDLAQLTVHAEVCRQSFALMEFDLPAEVRTFYVAINAGLARLSHVTPEVLAWLAEHGYLDRFRVRSASE